MVTSSEKAALLMQSSVGRVVGDRRAAESVGVGEGVAGGKSVAVGAIEGISLGIVVAVGAPGVDTASIGAEVPQAANSRTNKGKIRMVFIE